tara:strand:- start:9 stop:479 length:471 start_codon:yes stop_codon:yes gene_type:complete
MNLGLDFHDTISYAPDFFRELIKGWSGKVYIVTGTPPSKRDEVFNDLEKLGFIEGKDYEDILCGFEYEKKDMGLKHFENMAYHKLSLLKRYNITVFFDDNPYYVDLIKDYDIQVFQPVMSKKYLKAFKKADPFFTCNLQKMQFDYLNSLKNKKMKK